MADADAADLEGGMSEHVTTAYTWADKPLTVADLLRAWETIWQPWVPIIRNATAVEVRGSEFLPPRMVYAIDCDAADSAWLVEPTGRVMVVCRPEDREAVERAVAQIRESQP